MGPRSGTLTNTNDSSTINYNYDSNTGEMVLSVGSGTPTIGDFVGAEQDIQYSSSNSDPTAGGADPTRTVTWEVTDSNNNSSSPVTTTIDVAAIFAPTVTWGTVSQSGAEGQRIALQRLSATPNGGGTLQSLVISGIPVGDTLSGGPGHSFTAAPGNTSVNVSMEILSASRNHIASRGEPFTGLTVRRGTEARDGSDPAQTSTATESVTVGAAAADKSPTCGQPTLSRQAAGRTITARSATRTAAWLRRSMAIRRRVIATPDRTFTITTNLRRPSIRSCCRTRAARRC